MPWWTGRCICPRHGLVTATAVARPAYEMKIGYQSKADLGLGLLRRAHQAGHLTAASVTADGGYGEVPSLRDTLNAGGWCHVLEVPCNT
jgi:hypothetical protein